MANRALQLLLLSACVFFTVCVPDAPHDNPLDPALNREASTIKMQGQVLHKNPPHFPVSNCLLFLEPEQTFARSNENGYFEFSLQSSETHYLSFSKEGYDNGTMAVESDSLKNRTFTIYLNGKPNVKSAMLFSEFIDQWWPDPISFLNTEILVDDIDGINDLTDIFLTVADDSTRFDFRATARPDSFVLRIDALDLPGQNLSNLVGVDLWVHAVDSSRSHVMDGPHRIVRVMTLSPIPVSPVALEETPPNPLFRWSSYQAAFPHTFEVSVFHISAGIPVQIFQERSMPAGTIKFQYPDSLASGSYFWTIGVRDLYGNFVRSKEASFKAP